MKFVSRSVKLAAHALDVMRPPTSGLVVLLYHRVGARTSIPVDLPTAMFDHQMQALAASGSVMSLGDAVTDLEHGRDLSGRVVVTFDDGTADFVDVVTPIVERHRIPTTLFVATDFVERNTAFPDDGRPASWSGLAQSVSTGLVTIGSHTHNHALLDRLDPASIDDELDRSIDLIGSRLGSTAEHFAYPKALRPSPYAAAAVRRRFRSAALAGTRPNPMGADVFRLRRSPIQVVDADRWFAHKLAGGLRLEDDLRTLVNRRRYREAVA